MGKRGLHFNSILLEFLLIFLVFLSALILLASSAIYQHQMRYLEAASEQTARETADYLRQEILQDEADFYLYQNYVRAHKDELELPPYFEEYQTAQRQFEQDFVKEYPGECFGADVAFEEMPKTLQNEYIIYRHEYWQLLFERVRDSFNVAYTYYIVPTGVENYVEYVIDVERIEEETADGGIKLHLCDLYPEDYEELAVMWKTWETGEQQQECDVFDNEYGVTNSYYTPLYLNGHKMGVICVDADVTDLFREVNSNTLRMTITLAIIMIVLLLALIWAVNNLYIARVKRLQNQVKEYTEQKNPEIAKQIGGSSVFKDELTQLASLIADMITELDTYMKNLVKARKQANELNALAMRDPMTGVENNRSYEAKLE